MNDKKFNNTVDTFYDAKEYFKSLEGKKILVPRNLLRIKGESEEWVECTITYYDFLNSFMNVSYYRTDIVEIGTRGRSRLTTYEMLTLKEIRDNCILL